MRWCFACFAKEHRLGLGQLLLWAYCRTGAILSVVATYTPRRAPKQAVQAPLATTEKQTQSRKSGF